MSWYLAENASSVCRVVLATLLYLKIILWEIL